MKTMYARMAAGFVPAFEGEGGTATAEPASTGASSGGSPAPHTGAGAPPAALPGASAGAGEPRTYKDEDVQRIVRERLADEQKKWAPYKELGDPKEVRARLERADRYEKAFKGEAPNGPTPEEKELRDLLDKHGYVRKDQVDEVSTRLKAIESANQAAHAKSGRDLITKLASEKLSTSDPKVVKMLENVISASIAENEESLKAWHAGDVSVVAKHFEDVLASSLDPLFKSASARYSSGKAKDKAEVPPTMPKGGVQAPASQERKMTPDERKEAAYKFLKEREGQE